MKDWISTSTDWFNKYYGSFNNLTENHKRIFEIKKDHSLRVADIALVLTEKLEWAEEEKKIAFLVGLLHDIGRFSQMAEFDTFDDDKSEDHAVKAINILKGENLLEDLNILNKELIYTAILNHNKFKIQEGLTGQELLHSKLIRDADKLDIFRVLTEYYSQRKGTLHHSLSWELQKGTVVTPFQKKC